MRTFRLADAGNTIDPALSVILAKGYQVYLLPDPHEDSLGDFWAIKEGRDFIASDPLRLLGLIALWEHTGDEWQKRPRGFYREIVDRAFPSEGDFTGMDTTTFERHMAHYRPFFEALDLPVPLPVTPLELFEVLSHLPDILNRDA